MAEDTARYFTKKDIHTASKSGKAVQPHQPLGKHKLKPQSHATTQLLELLC
jgi:hypothetical protein